MALSHSKYVLGGKRVPASQWAGDMVSVRYDVTVPADMDAADIIELGILPAHHKVVDAIAISDALDDDSTPTLRTVDVGLMSGEVGAALDPDGGARTCGAELFDGTSVGEGGVTRASLASAFQIAPVAYDRSIGVVLATAGEVPAEGLFSLTVFYST
jgi:hypothetical protein